MSTIEFTFYKNSTVVPVSAIQKIFQTSLSIMILTLLHHAYGALIYEEPFRLHVVFIAIPVILIMIMSFRLFQRKSSALIKKLAFTVFMLVSISIPVSAIGLYEGGYNHLLKNVLYFGGSSQAMLNQLFPPPLYEMPNSFIFEVTGIFQFVLGIYAVYCMMLFWKERYG